VANWTLADYERAAEEYCASLPLEHFMEAMGQATQRKITWVSLDLVATQRGRMQVFNELLIQYPRNGGVGQVVPDNMVIRSRKKIQTGGSYNTAFESAHPFWVLEYVSKSNRRKDYEDNFLKYQDDLKVPYYLLFDPERQDLRVFRHTGTAFIPIEPNENGRLAVREIEVEVALLDRWARLWHRGELVPLPDDLQKQVTELHEQLDQARTQAVQARRRAERMKQRAEDEKRRAEDEKRRAEDEKRRADQAEAELQRLRALLGQGGPPSPPVPGVGRTTRRR
jgi:Uma2 family endonuclease